MPQKPLLAVIIVGVATSIFFGSRYAQLGRTVEANQEIMTAHLIDTVGAASDASVRIAARIHADEKLFDDTLVALAARRTAGIVALVALIIAIPAIGMARRGNRGQRTAA